MVILIAGASHTGKTKLAQGLMERLQYPYLSIDHLKMGLIRSGYTALTPTDEDGALTAYLWPVVREMIKTCIENGQDLIVEGCYIPFDWRQDFTEEYLDKIRYVCLVMSREYIENRFDRIKAHANDIEQRLEDGCTKEQLIKDNEENLRQCRRCGCRYVLIEDQWDLLRRELWKEV